jgi:hypothetical protein
LHVEELIGLSGVRALPLAAGINEGGYYFLDIIPPILLLELTPLFKTTEGVVKGFQIFAWAPKQHKFLDSKKKKSRGPPYPPHYDTCL